MKLVIILSVAACCYAAKLDRTYLPPASASTAGGSPGSLVAPNAQPGEDPAYRPSSGPAGFDQRSQSGRSGFNQAASSFGQPSGSGSFGEPAKYQQSSEYSQPGASGSQFGPSGLTGPEGPGFGPTRSGFEAPADFSRPQQYQPERPGAANDRNAEILRYENQNDGEKYSYSFETSNGISAEESGVATNGVQAQGGYSYTGDDGQQYRVTYTADENGFVPLGDHLPTPHPIPEEILKSIEENARAAAAGIQEGAYNPDEDFDKNSIAPQQYNAEAGPSNQGGALSYESSGPAYQGSAQPSGPISGSYRQAGQGPSTQYGTPSPTGSAKSSGPQNFQSQPSQYQSGPNEASPISQTRPSNTGFPGQRGPEQRSFESDNSGLVRSGYKNQRQDDSGYQYNQPQGSSPASNRNQAGQFRPQQPEPQKPSGSQYDKPQAQGPSGRGFELTDDSASGSNRPVNKEFGTSSSNSPSGLGYAPAGAQGSSFSKLNTQSQGNGPSAFSPRPTGSNNQGLGSAPSNTPSEQGYAPAGAPQGPTFSKPSPYTQTSGPSGYSAGSAGPSKQGFGTTTLNTPSGQGYAPAGAPQGPKFSKPSSFTQTSGPSRYSAGSAGPSKQGFGTTTSNTPSEQGYAPAGAPQGPTFSKPSSFTQTSRPSGYSTGSAGPTKQGFGNSPSGQGYAAPGLPPASFSRPSTSTQENRPAGYSSGSNEPRKQGFGTTSSNVPSSQGYSPAGAPQRPSYSSGPAQGSQPHSEGSPSLGQGSAFSRPNSAAKSYSPASPSTFGSPSFAQGSTTAKPNSAAPSYSQNGPSTSPQGSQRSSSDGQGYEYGPGKPGSGSPKGLGFGNFPSSASGTSSPAAPQQGPFSRPTAPGYSPSNVGPAKGAQDFRPTGPSNFGQAPQGSFEKPSASTGPTQTSQGPYFAKPPGPTGSSSSSPQGSFESAPAYQPGQTSGSKPSMPDSAPYQYNRPGNQGSQNGTPSQSVSGFRPESGAPAPQGGSAENRPGSRPTESFGGPRQPPSFSPEEGYKY